MVLNDAGHMVEKWYNKTQDKFPDIICHGMIIMPNHFHCIWENVGLHGALPVGADPCVRPIDNNGEHVMEDAHAVNDKRGIIEGAHMDAPRHGFGYAYRITIVGGGGLVQNHVHQRIHSWGETIGLATFRPQIVATQLLRTHHPQRPIPLRNIQLHHQQPRMLA